MGNGVRDGNVFRKLGRRHRRVRERRKGKVGETGDRVEDRERNTFWKARTEYY